MGSGTEKENFKLYLMLMHLNLNSHVATTVLHSARVRVLRFRQEAFILARRIYSPPDFGFLLLSLFWGVLLPVPKTLWGKRQRGLDLGATLSFLSCKSE